jgi:hypothetical protein
MKMYRVISVVGEDDGHLWYYPQKKWLGFWHNLRPNRGYTILSRAYEAIDEYIKMREYGTEIHPYPRDEENL